MRRAIHCDVHLVHALLHLGGRTRRLISVDRYLYLPLRYHWPPLHQHPFNLAVVLPNACMRQHVEQRFVVILQHNGVLLRELRSHALVSLDHLQNGNQILSDFASVAFAGDRPPRRDGVKFETMLFV